MLTENITKIDYEDYNHLIELAFKEDIADGDITTNAIIPDKLKANAYLIAKQDGILCGMEIFENTFKKIDPIIGFANKKKDGDELNKGDIISIMSGYARSILTAERTALNFIQHLSGIATKTRNMVALLKKNSSTLILDTRKTMPGFRKLEKYAVNIGGGQNHRIGLYDMFLIKDNHIRIAGVINIAIEKARNYNPEIPIEIEVSTLKEIEDALKGNPNIIMLDNMENSIVEKAVQIIKEYNKKHDLDTKTEVSGNITEARIQKLSEIGVDYISIGALTHSVKAFDFSLMLDM